MKRSIVIGDVHGCLVELKELIEMLKLQSCDDLYFIGDLIDRGYSSSETVKYVYELSMIYNLKLILGNHEAKFLRFIHNFKNNPRALKDMKGVASYPQLLTELNDEEIQFLKRSYYNFTIPELGVLLVHAGVLIKNNIDFSINYQYHLHPAKQYKGIDLLSMVRHINKDGNMVSLGNENDETHFWAEQYDGRYGTVIFGHQPFMQDSPMIFPFAIGIDTGCVFGGCLTALILKENEKYEFSTIKPKQKYSKL